jgi:hypothetical protein
MAGDTKEFKVEFYRLVMVHITPEYLRKVAENVRASEIEQEIKYNEFFKKYKNSLKGLGFVLTKGYEFGSLDCIFSSGSELDISQCFADFADLKIISPIISTHISGKESAPRAIYECSKCGIHYVMNLNEKDLAVHKTRMQEMVFR